MLQCNWARVASALPRARPNGRLFTITVISEIAERLLTYCCYCLKNFVVVYFQLLCEFTCVSFIFSVIILCVSKLSFFLNLTHVFCYRLSDFMFYLAHSRLPSTDSELQHILRIIKNQRFFFLSQVNGTRKMDRGTPIVMC